MITKVIGLIVTLGVLYMIVAGGFTLAYYTRTGAGTKNGTWYQDRKKWIPKSWLNWAGYPAVFSNISGVKPTSTSVYKTLTNQTVSQCMLACDGANDRSTTNCGAFTYNPTSNTCTMYSGVNGLISNTTSNVLYFISGLDATVKQFFPVANKAPPAAGYAVVANSSIETCAANCVSNATCTGFTFTGTSCGLYSDMDETKFTTQNNVTSYPLKDHAELTSASDVKYWT